MRARSRASPARLVSKLGSGRACPGALPDAGEVLPDLVDIARDGRVSVNH